MKKFLFGLSLVVALALHSGHATAATSETDVACPASPQFTVALNLEVPTGWKLINSSLGEVTQKTSVVSGSFSGAGFSNNGTGGGGFDCEYELSALLVPPSTRSITYGPARTSISMTTSTQCHVGGGWQQDNGISWSCSSTNTAACALVCPQPMSFLQEMPGLDSPTSSTSTSGGRREN